MMERGPRRSARRSSYRRTARLRRARRSPAATAASDAGRIVAAARELSRRAVLFDMEVLRAPSRRDQRRAVRRHRRQRRARVVASEVCEAAIRAGGIGVGEPHAFAGPGPSPPRDAGGQAPAAAENPLAPAAGGPPGALAVCCRAGGRVYETIGAAQALSPTRITPSTRCATTRASNASSLPSRDPAHPVAREVAALPRAVDVLRGHHPRRRTQRRAARAGVDPARRRRVGVRSRARARLLRRAPRRSPPCCRGRSASGWSDGQRRGRRPAAAA